MAKFKLFGQGGFFSKIGKRNLVIIGAVLLVGAAVWVNYALFFGSSTPVDYGKNNMQDNNDANQTQNQQNNSVATYFSSAKLSRQQAREEALAVLKTVAQSADAKEETRNKALTDISKIAVEIENESNIEALVKAKGFEECVAVLSGDSVSVIVKCDAPLTASQTAQINEIVYSQAGIVPANVKIIQK